MVLAVTVCLLGLTAVLYTVYTEEPLAAPAPARPEWDLLPTPADVARGDFPLAFPGYDPASVEAHFERLRQAYADLYAAAPAEVLDRARQRAALREGRGFEGHREAPWVAFGADLPAPRERERWVASSEPERRDEDDDLRLEAALAAVDPPAAPAYGDSS